MTLHELAKRRAAGLPPPCVDMTENSAALTVHLADGAVWVLPWSRFCHACVVGEELTLTFSDVEVMVRGQNLGAVTKNVATLNIDVLRTLPEQYRPVIPHSEPFISEIDVTPT